MDAIGIERGCESPRLLEVPKPDPTDGEALIRTLRVGVDGTDHEVIAGTHGGFPEDDDHLVLGHEAVGVVEDPNDTGFERGDVVAPTVRRPPEGGTNQYFERGEADMAPPTETVERGIDGAHGFMSEYFTSPEAFLVSVPEALAELGFLLEPISISEKALELAYASRSSFAWEPETAFVLGNGPLGLLTVAMLADDMRVYCLGRRDRPDPSIDIVESLGATYVDSRETPVEAVPDVHEPMDLIYEATGYAKHAFDSIDALAPNGVAALLGVPEPWTFDVDGGRLHKEFVMHNKALVGSVNSGPSHFRAAVDRLGALPDPFLEAFVTGIVPHRGFERAFEQRKTDIKTAVEFDSI
ncbi:MAG: threonine dehydrogenase-like Zn-dependent dehydrogenase [Natronomonas sp.]|jgi:threonine dehydrogenase-like Zn-dependent dehydrogenase|uniref:glucose 1-dehydrogenase n=1 Tax=Natronomonas sp. TaxID=2184060 RepID=UPI003988F923